MASSIRIHVLWNKNHYEITMRSFATVHDLRKKIFKNIGVDPSQKSLLFDSKEMPDDHTPLQQLKLRSDSIVVLTTRVLNPAKLTFPEAAEPGPSKKTATTSQPRRDKLVVLGIDRTIFDVKGLRKSLYRAQRPNLQKFLKNVYEDYEIIIWFGTEMVSIEQKLRCTNMSNNPSYKILCCLDHDSMVPIPWTGPPMRYVKSLEVVWKKYPEYNKKNTIICDNKDYNLLLNKGNGVLIEPYSFTNYDSDRELELLAQYLKNIALSYDMSTINHAKWRISTNAPTNLTSAAIASLTTKQPATTRQPGSGKLLLVLDIDKTIIDGQGLCESLLRAQRPHLHEFLKSVNDDYEIIFWSGTDMASIQWKLNYSNINRNPHYKILCYLDRDSMVPYSARNSSRRHVKSLEVVWKIYPEYNKKNTIICDSKKSNLYLNKENGVLVHPYSFTNYDSDRELERLAWYLKYISLWFDLSTINHAKWRELAK